MMIYSPLSQITPLIEYHHSYGNANAGRACTVYKLKLTRMFRGLVIGLCLLAIITHSKPVYDYHNSYITQLTQINFKDQVTKIRQNTNYVSVVHFYKYNGKHRVTQTELPSREWKSSPSGSTSTTESSVSEQLTATSRPRSAAMRV